MRKRHVERLSGYESRRMSGSYAGRNQIFTESGSTGYCPARAIKTRDLGVERARSSDSCGKLLYTWPLHEISWQRRLVTCAGGAEAVELYLVQEIMIIERLEDAQQRIGRSAAGFARRTLSA
jgi:hypothetical protein